MSLLRFPHLILSFALLSSPIAAVAQTDRPVQHLTCQKDAAVWTCTIDETQEVVLVKDPAQPKEAQLGSTQLSQLSDGLIGLSFGLPIALVFAVMLGNKRADQRTKRLQQLERILQES